MRDTLDRDEHLRKCLIGLGLNLPPLIHSSIMRFKATPKKPAVFLSRFDEIAASIRLESMEIDEILVTIETKPYMRAGTAIRPFSLPPRKN